MRKIRQEGECHKKSEICEVEQIKSAYHPLDRSSAAKNEFEYTPKMCNIWKWSLTLDVGHRLTACSVLDKLLLDLWVWVH